MIEHYTIISERQDNGLWGLPLYLKNIKGNIILKDSYKAEVLSAVLVSFAENKKLNFSLEMKTDEHFEIRTDIPYYYSMDNFGLIGNTLYFLPEDDDKLSFSRLLKLTKLTNVKQQVD